MIQIQYKLRKVDILSGDLVDPDFYQDSFATEEEAIFELEAEIKQFPYCGQYEYVLQKTYRVTHDKDEKPH